MRETVRSIGLYLTIAGVLGSIAQLTGILDPDAWWLDRLVSLVGLAITGAYLFTGVKLRALLSSQSPIPRKVLMAGAAYSIAVSLLIVILHAINGTPLSANPEGIAQIGRSAFGLLLTMYLLASVRRLAAEQLVIAAS